MQVGLCLAGGTAELARVDPAYLADLGFAALFVGCYEDDLRWRAEELAMFVRRARAQQLQVYALPWGYGRVLDPDPAIPSLYVETHPQTLQIDSRGRRCPKACPNNPYYLEWFSSSMRTLAWLTECHGFVWDEPSFHFTRGSWACHCSYCQRLYQAQNGHELPRDFSPEVISFRESSLVMFLLAAAAAVQSVDYRLESLILPTPALPGSIIYSGSGNWDKLTACSACDRLCVFVPWQHHQVPLPPTLRDLQKEAVRHTRRYDKGSVLWLAASPSPRDQVLEALHLAHLAGTETLVLADYGSLIDNPNFARFASQFSKTLHAAGSHPQATP
jgi:hypothetical protein